MWVVQGLPSWRALARSGRPLPPALHDAVHVAPSSTFAPSQGANRTSMPQPRTFHYRSHSHALRTVHSLNCCLAAPRPSLLALPNSLPGTSKHQEQRGARVCEVSSRMAPRGGRSGHCAFAVKAVPLALPDRPGIERGSRVPTCRASQLVSRRSAWNPSTSLQRSDTGWGGRAGASPGGGGGTRLTMRPQEEQEHSGMQAAGP